MTKTELEKLSSKEITQKFNELKRDYKEAKLSLSRLRIGAKRQTLIHNIIVMDKMLEELR